MTEPKARDLLPIVMALAALLPVIGDLKTDAVRVGEKSRPVIGRVAGIILCLGGINARAAQCPGNRHDILDAIHAQAEVMQAGRMGIMRGSAARWSQHITEVPVVVLDVRFALQGEFVLAESQYLQQHDVVKGLRTVQVGDGDVDVVDTGDCGHDLGLCMVESAAQSSHRHCRKADPFQRGLDIKFGSG